MSCAALQVLELELGTTPLEHYCCSTMAAGAATATDTGNSKQNKCCFALSGT
jgi:hypothetical protein